MKFSAIFLAATLLPAVFASYMPQVVEDKIDQVRFNLEDNDPCPDFLVRCIKDGDITNPIGDVSFQNNYLVLFSLPNLRQISLYSDIHTLLPGICVASNRTLTPMSL